jgi:hypothetical protein
MERKGAMETPEVETTLAELTKKLGQLKEFL